MILSFATAIVVASSLPQHAPTPDATAAAFLEAFKQMDPSRFDAFFAPDVTMFFPDGPFPEARVDGREAVLSAFHEFFERVRESGRTALSITAVDQRVQQYGDVAIVTFGLDQQGAVGRRSIVLRRFGEEWLVVHFHASTIDP